MNTISETLSLAYQQHQAGNFPQAEYFYRQVLQSNPEHVDALHLLGVLALQLGRNDDAHDFISQALRIKPDFAEAYSNLGNVLQRQGRLPEAIDHWQRALRLRPDIPAVHSNLGLALLEQGQADEAIACFRRALQLNPAAVEAHNLLGNAFKSQGDLEQAVACYHAALRLAPDYAPAHLNLGAALQEQGQLAEAVACYHQALKFDPNSAGAHGNLGLALKELGNLDEALASLQRAVQLMPTHAETHLNLGLVLQEQGQLDQAASCYQQALRLNPAYVEAYTNLGLLFVQQGKPAEAVQSCRQALQIQPDLAEALGNLGVALQRQGKLVEALACWRQALVSKPDYPDAHFGMGGTLRHLGKFEEAVPCYQQAVRCQPDFAEAHGGLATTLLLLGRFDEGWPEFEWRSKSEGHLPPAFRQPVWDGSPLAGRTILLHAEQGWGDTLQFIRYASLVKARGGRVLVTCPPSLLRLLGSCPGIDELFSEANPPDDFDVHAALMSLPGLLRTTLATIPADVPYLSADAELIEAWRAELSGYRGFKIGIAWQGNPGYRGDLHRSVPLAHFAPLAGLEGVRLFSLQKGAGTEQLPTVADRVPVTVFGRPLDEAAGAFMDTAAVMQSLDLVITSDTAIAHLAGALGAPVWVAIPFSPDWRWLLHRSDSPWYPTMQLFRQPEPDNWRPVFERMAEELEIHLGASASNREALRFDANDPQWRHNPTAAIPDQQTESLAQASAAAHSKIGNAMYASGKLDEAVANYRQALRHKPDFADVHNNLGAALYQQGKLDEAVDAYQQALRCKPEYAEALSNLGAVLFAQRKLEQSADCYRQALRLNPNYAAAYSNLGTTLKEQGRFEESTDCYRQAVRLDPDNAEAHLNLGVALAEQDKAEEAVVCYQQALRLKPDYAEAHNNLGGALKDQGKLEEAATCFQQAVQIRPDYAEAHNNLGLAWLLMGKLEQGWPEYEWRYRIKGAALPHFSQPRWDGSPLAGRTILLHTEQGWGDSLQFIRYASVIQERGARVAVSCSARLARLLSSSPGIDWLVPHGDPLPPFDVHAPLLSMPGMLATSLATVPAKVPYLFADPALIEFWRQVLSDRSRGPRTFKVGIAWQGNPAYYGDRRRSIPLQQFAPLARLPGVQLISLQKGIGSEQLAAVADRMAVTDLGPQLDQFGGTFMDTAAVIQRLDLVVTSDTAIAHLAGALGAAVWLALAFVPDWRWMLRREDCPWYPTMRLFRQPTPGDWRSVFERMAGEVENRADQGH